MENLLRKHAEKIRFAIVGAANTLIDVAIYSLLIIMGWPAIAGNYISTSTALIFSFFANKKYTFKDIGGKSHKQFAYFITITLFGLWVIQPIIIESIKVLLSPARFDNLIVSLIGKIIATALTLVWNYFLYKKFVFNRGNQ